MAEADCSYLKRIISKGTVYMCHSFTVYYPVFRTRRADCFRYDFDEAEIFREKGGEQKRMRPVTKGEAPDQELKRYQDAEQYLEERLGAYCSFCEMPISHVPEVEHKEAKTKGGEEMSWGNLLLSCKYCNTRKGTIVKRGDKEKYLWPDEDDTFHAFLYEDDIPKLNEEYLLLQGKQVRQKAENLFRLVKLDNIPFTPAVKDRRYAVRNEARNYALGSKQGWDKIKKSAEREEYLQIIEMLAQSSGFFSVWMNVFKDDMEVRQILINAFKGTKREYCNG